MYCKSNVFKIKVVNTIWEIILSIKGTTPLSSTWNKVQKFEEKKKKKKNDAKLFPMVKLEKINNNIPSPYYGC